MKEKYRNNIKLALKPSKLFRREKKIVKKVIGKDFTLDGKNEKKSGDKLFEQNWKD